MSGYSFKIVVLGSARVGKTSLTTWFWTSKFDEDQKSTKNAYIQTKRIKLENHLVQLNIWVVLLVRIQQGRKNSIL